MATAGHTGRLQMPTGPTHRGATQAAVLTRYQFGVNTEYEYPLRTTWLIARMAFGLT